MEGCVGAFFQGKVNVDARNLMTGDHDNLGTPLMSFASSISLGQVCRIEKVLNKSMYYISRWASVVRPLHDANLKIKDLVRTISFLVGEPCALLSWVSGIEQRLNSLNADEQVQMIANFDNLPPKWL